MRGTTDDDQRRARRPAYVLLGSAVLQLVACGCVGLVAPLSLLPAETMVRTSLNGHVEHAMAYAGTALLMRLGYPKRKAWWIAGLLVTYAGILETLQHYAPGRTPAIEDWLASSIGALVGIGVANWVDRAFKRPLIPGPRPSRHSATAICNSSSDTAAWRGRSDGDATNGPGPRPPSKGANG